MGALPQAATPKPCGKTELDVFPADGKGDAPEPRAVVVGRNSSPRHSWSPQCTACGAPRGRQPVELQQALPPPLSPPPPHPQITSKASERTQWSTPEPGRQAAAQSQRKPACDGDRLALPSEPQCGLGVSGVPVTDYWLA